MVFHKSINMGQKRIGLGKIFRHQYEMILWASNQNAYIHNDGKVHSNILVHSPTFSKDRLHPVEKPQSLFEEILDIISCENQTVLDCFCGSGTTLAACENMKRRWIGIEMSREYCDIARKRIEKEAMQLKFI